MFLCKYDLSRECDNTEIKDCTDCILDKIRDEIEKKYTKAKQMHWALQMNAYIDCLQIIDKYKGKSED